MIKIDVMKIGWISLEITKENLERGRHSLYGQELDYVISFIIAICVNWV